MGDLFDDERSHFPSDADPHWQESWAFAWLDPVHGVGGWHHIGLARPRGVADIWSVVWQRGVAVHRQQDLALDIPEQDFAALTLGAITTRTRTPLEEHEIVIADAAAGIRATLEVYRANDPIRFAYTAAKGHWETYGRFNGSVEIAGTSIAVSGHAFLDRSWGSRQWSDILTYRLIWAAFGDDLAFKIYVMQFRAGPQIFGFIIEAGHQVPIRHAEIDVVMASDGVSPKGGSARVWGEHGRAYQLDCVTEGTDIGVQREGFMCCHANALYECGGRLGTGFLEVQELKQAPPWEPSLQRILDEERGR